ncbi:MAG: hypothetical protein LQ339_002661 [Xanthoria mediterranea]|nr:MAG: hypothetical protein LQ339_002661 [Xanthoria mediterranea]
MAPSACAPSTTAVPTSESPPTWTFDPPTPKLHPDVSTQRPRAWERIPKSPFARRRNGKKVWKRYEAPAKAPVSEMGICLSLGCEDQTQETGAESIMHNAKRLRSRDVSIGGADGAEQKPSMYVTTLRDQVAGTPRRKAVRRRSLRPDRLKNVPLPTDVQDEGLTATAAPEPSTPATMVSIDTLTQTTNLEALEEEGSETEADPVQSIGGPLSDDIDEALSSPLSSDHVEEDQSNPRESPVISSPKIVNEWRPTADGHEREPAGTSSAEGIHSPRALPNQDTAALSISPESAEGTIPEASSDSSQVGDGPGSGHQTEQQPSAETESPEEKQPKRREDREKVSSHASTRLRQSLRRSSRRSLVKKDTVAKHGTAESTDWPTTVIETSEIKDHVGQTASSPSSVADQGSSESPSQDRSAQRASQCMSDEKEPGSALGFTEIRGTQRVDEDRDDADLFMPLKFSQEDIDANARASDESGPVGGPLVIHNDDWPSTDESGPSDHVIGNATVEQLPGDAIDAERHDVDSQVQMLDAKHHDTQSPQMKTRSGARFSDDTNMLKDFLSRAQARKLVMPVPVSDAATAATSPRRSQRNALATLDSNSPSPHKPRGLANHPGTPPRKPRLAEVPADGNDESTARGSPVRRSTRKRLPAPAKTATGAPSFIPVRRADGTDPVVLQKSVAQELALVTQTNTRRNKGQSRPPAVMLKSLAVEMVEEGTKGGHALRNCKSVGWDQKLVYYQDGTEAVVEVDSQKEEKRPKARRLRGLGTGNGTPAPKRKTADMLSANGRPGSKRPGRLR